MLGGAGCVVGWSGHDYCLGYFNNSFKMEK